MTDTHLKMQLENATVDLDKTTDVEGTLVVANDGRILHHNLRVDVDINLFSPMSQVISSSSLRLLNSSRQGDMERVLVESSKGKILFLSVENGHLIILMRNTANLGMVLVNAKRASQKINEATHNLTLEVLETEEISPEKIHKELTDQEIPVKNVTVEEEGIEESITAHTDIASIGTSDLSQGTESLEKTEDVIPDIPSESTIPPETATPEKTLVNSEGLTTIEDKTSEIEPESISKQGKETEKITDNLELSEPESAELLVEEKTLPETGKDLETKVEEEVVKIKAEVEEAESVEEVKESGPIIPTVKPPISFPSELTRVFSGVAVSGGIVDSDGISGITSSVFSRDSVPWLRSDVPILAISVCAVIDSSIPSSSTVTFFTGISWSVNSLCIFSGEISSVSNTSRVRLWVASLIFWDARLAFTSTIPKLAVFRIKIIK
jgi:predicted regulator of Ras-like GTPase activity (Roadblock/LC7/MglB family)